MFSAKMEKGNIMFMQCLLLAVSTKMKPFSNLKWWSTGFSEDYLQMGVLLSKNIYED